MLKEEPSADRALFGLIQLYSMDGGDDGDEEADAALRSSELHESAKKSLRRMMVLPTPSTPKRIKARASFESFTVYLGLAGVGFRYYTL